jgi:predicted RNase H-like nuclease
VTATPTLDLPASAAWSSLCSEIRGASTGSGLDRAEDEMDAYVCAYVAQLFWQFGDARTRVVGDVETGYIVTPVTSALAEKIDSERMMS